MSIESYFSDKTNVKESSYHRKYAHTILEHSSSVQFTFVL